ncbi:hypothetical protein Pst134EA_032844 [Puccinia striiformis f. sp. tritici]|uniref:uncharacterized protein n=1 Tax=Puccinia striiformis f. sp. tritici TaxID=168172 RepID=UPI00200893E8|nr:uncharacterized protein Pst134EA_032844 [Puccinia striiformis f. sp. tritici]KAH9441581.1 hypothetical protein Pst134EA_032844 [Puccinia striiformis f. sp. tritici]
MIIPSVGPTTSIRATSLREESKVFQLAIFRQNLPTSGHRVNGYILAVFAWIPSSEIKFIKISVDIIEDLHNSLGSLTHRHPQSAARQSSNDQSP